MTDLHVRALGPLEVYRDGIRVEIPGRRQRELLAVLLLLGRASNRRIIEAIWGDVDDGRANLQAAVKTLRTNLKSPDHSGDSTDRTYVHNETDGYSLHLETVEYDLVTFRQLCRSGDMARQARDATAAADHYADAEALWHGERLMEDVILGGSEDLDLAADSLDQELQAAVAGFAEARLALGDSRAMLPYLRERVRRWPDNPTLCGLYVDALAQEGQVGPAQEHLEAFKARERQADLVIEIKQIRRNLNARSTGNEPPGHYSRTEIDNVEETLLDEDSEQPVARATLTGPHGTRLLPATTFLIGRGAKCHLRITDDPLVSAQHASIEYDGTEYVLHDEDSRNGTFLNESRTTQATLRDHAEIRVGRTILHFRLASAAQ